jgi:hypothetical protein
MRRFFCRARAVAKEGARGTRNRNNVTILVRTALMVAAHPNGQCIRIWCTEAQGVRAELTVRRAGQVGLGEVPRPFWAENLSVYNIQPLGSRTGL